MKRNKEKYLVFAVFAFAALITSVLLSRASHTSTITVSNLNYEYGIAVGDSFRTLSQTELTAYFDDIASLHVGWLRVDFDWSEIQPHSKSEYNWSHIDAIVEAATARHIHMLPILTYTPGWARDGGCNSSKCAPRDPEEFAAFAKAAAQRYSTEGVHTWEIWNEENLSAFWQPSPSPARYAALLHASHEAIHAVDNTATVLVGGLGPTPPGGPNIPPVTFLSQLYELGASNTFEAVGYHPYSYPKLPSDYSKSNGWSQMASTSPSIRSVMVAYGDSSKKVWITEFGTPTGGPSGLTDSFQSQSLTSAVDINKAYPWVGPFFWYSYKDLGRSADTNENFFGLVRYDGTQKTSYTVLKDILNQ